MKNKWILLLVMVLFLSSSFPSVLKAEAEDEVIYARFHVVASGRNATIEVPFNRQWFDGNASEYSHDLAKLSLGLATAAFRPKTRNSAYHESPDKNLHDFLTAAHFKDIRSDDYDKNPSMYTVSTAMGHQKIEGAEGPFELIAVGVCGMGYVDEWESNFSIGNSFNHEGFDRSSRLVYDRIFGYIAEEHLQGPLKIWISGFSRAAAIANLTAARLSDADAFDQDSVFAYTFATPRTTTDTNTLRYQNIFNIVGKADPVTLVPFEQWGYGRYGLDLYTPIMETDSDFEAKRVKANEIYRKISGIDYWYNREVNETLHNILSYVLTICPTSKLYTESLQDKLIHIWEHKDPINIMAALLEISEDPLLINEETRTQANELMNYLMTMMISYRSSTGIFRSWNPSASTGGNLLQAHTPELYVSWLYSTNSYEELYSDSDRYNVLYIISPLDVTLSLDGKVLESIETLIDYDYVSKDTVDLVDKSERKIPEGNIYLGYLDDDIYALIPGDRSYSLSFSASEEDTMITVMALDHTIYSGLGNLLQYFSYRTKTGDELSIRNLGDGQWVFEAADGIDDSRLSEAEFLLDTSDTVLISRQRSYFNLSWRQAAIITIAAVIILISSFFFYIAFAVGRIRFLNKVRKGWIAPGSRYSVLPLIGSILIVQLFFIREFYSVLFPESKILLMGFKAAIALISVLIAYLGYQQRKDDLSRMVLYALALLGVADVTVSEAMIPGVLLHIAAYVLLAYAYIRTERPGRNQLIVFTILFVISFIIVFFIKGEYGILRLMSIIYMFVVLSMIVASFPLSRKVFTGSLLLFLAGILLILNYINGQTFISHIVSLGTYYAGIITLSRMGTGYQLPAALEEVEEAI